MPYGGEFHACPAWGLDDRVLPVLPRRVLQVIERSGDGVLLPGCGIPGHLMLLSLSRHSRSPGYFQVAESQVMIDVSSEVR